MATPRHLSRAPITEALFDFRVSLPAEFQADSFSPLRERLRDRYPIVDEIRQFSAVFEIKSGKTVSQSETGGLQGLIFKSEDGKTVAQFRRDGFTLNRLPEYTGWDELCPEALRLWSLFVELTSPERVDRLALRYINRLSLPANGRLNDHLEVPPPAFPGAPQLWSSFLVKQSRHDPATGQMANIVEALEPDLASGGSVLLLDIDVYKTGGLGLRSAELQPSLDGLRRLKNDIFFGAITERTAREYE